MSDKLKVACICADPGISVNGWKKDSSLQIQEFVGALTAAGCEVHLFAANTEFAPAQELASASVHSLAAPPKRFGRLSQRKVSLISSQVLKSSLQEQGPFDIVYEWFSLWSGVGMQYASDHGIAGILNVDAGIVVKLDRYSRLVDEISAQKFTHRCFSNATVVAAESQDIAARLSAYVAARGKIQLLTGSIDTKNITSLSQRSWEHNGTFTVGYVGKLDSRHAIDDLVCGFADLYQRDRHSRLLIVGSGAGRRDARSMIRARGLENVTTLTGRLPSTEVRALKRHMDTIVVPAAPAFSESTSPRQLLGHMASGAVVVAAASDATRSTIHSGVNGMLYEPGDNGALTNILHQLRWHGSFAQALSKNAQQHVRSHHSMGNTCQALLEIVHRHTSLAARQSRPATASSASR